MPEAAVDEHGDLGTRKHQVGAATQPGQRRHVDAVAQSSGVNLPAQGQLWCSVTGLLPAKTVTDRHRAGQRGATGPGGSVRFGRSRGEWWVHACPG